MRNSTYNFPDILLIEVRIDCHIPRGSPGFANPNPNAPLGVTVSPPLLNVMPLAAASEADQTDVGAPPLAPDWHDCPFTSMVTLCGVPADRATEPHEETTVAWASARSETAEARRVRKVRRFMAHPTL